MEKVEQQVRRIEDTVRELLSFARPREPILEAVKVHEIIDVAFRRLFGPGEKRSTVTKHVAQDLPVLSVDREAFTGALVNLFANSLDALPEKGTRVITTSASASDVRVSVRDDGTGIAPESIGRGFSHCRSRRRRVGLHSASQDGVLQGTIALPRLWSLWNG